MPRWPRSPKPDPQVPIHPTPARLSTVIRADRPAPNFGRSRVVEIKAGRAASGQHRGGGLDPAEPGTRPGSREVIRVDDAQDKMRNKSQEVRGKAKEQAGKLTDDEELEAKGKADQAKAAVKQAGEKIKDAFDR